MKKTDLTKAVRRSISLILIFCICACIPPVLASASPSTVESVKYNSYEQYLANYYLTESVLDYYLNEYDLPYHTYVINASDDFKDDLATWRLVNMDAGDIATFSDKEVEFYEFLIFDVLYQSIAENALLKNAQTGVNALQSSVLTAIAEAGLDWNKTTKIDEENAAQILDRLIMFDNLKFLASKVSILEKGLKYTKNLGELIEKLYMLMQLKSCTDEVRVILEDLYESASDPLVKEACRKTALVATGLMSEAEIMQIFTGEMVVEEVTSFALNKIWDRVVSSTALGQSIAIGVAVGKLVCNIWYSPDKTVESWYSMEKVYTFDKLLESRLRSYMAQYQSNPTIENARLFNKAAEMYLNTLSVGVGYSIEYCYAVKAGGFLGWLYKNFNEEGYESVALGLKVSQGIINSDIDYINNNVYNQFLTELASRSEVYVEWEETPCTVTQTDVEENHIEMIDYLFMLTNQTTQEDTTYTKDMRTFANYCHKEGTLDLAGQTLTVYGDFVLEGGTVNLNGGTLDVRGDVYLYSDMNLMGGTVNVGGNLIQSGGTLDIAKGSLNISGNYYIASSSTNSADEIVWSGCGAALQMEYAEDTVSVSGDFYIHSYKGIYSAGTLSVGGDFTQVGDVTYLQGHTYGFNPSGSHKVILNGTTQQTVSFDNSRCAFNILEISNSSGIIIKSYFAANSLNSSFNEITIESQDAEIRNILIEIPLTKIKGNVIKSDGILNLNGNQVKIIGNLIHKTGEIIISKGILDISGNYYIASSSTNSADEIVWSGCGAALQMEYAEDTVSVSGDFYIHSYKGIYSAGTLSVGGDFAQVGDVTYLQGHTYGFNPSGSHKVILNGTTQQTVSFDNSRCSFNMLEIKNGSGIIARCYFSATSLISDLGEVKIQSENADIQALTIDVPQVTITGDVTKGSGTLNLKSNALTVDGSLTQTAGTVLIGKGTLSVTGDYRIQTPYTDEIGDINWNTSSGILSMTYAEGCVKVDGDFYTNSTQSHSSHLTAGTLYISGDYTQYAGNSHNFNTSGTHKTILCGSTHQTAQFESTLNQSRFNILALTQAMDQYTFIPNPCWITLEETTHSHVYTAEIKAPTCTEPGYTTHTCTCGDTYTDSETAALGHTEETIPAVAPTCTESGLTDGKKCSVCGTVTTAQQTIPATGHTWDAGTVTQEPTEAEEGEKHFTCTVCGETKTEAIPTLDHVHSYTSTVTDPTCTTAGCTTHTCTCGDTYTDTETAALGHTEEAIPAVAPTCTTDGLTEGKKCSVCGTVTVAQQTIPATGHTWDAGTVTQQPTESEEGEATYTCTACGETKTEAIPTLDHVHSYTSTVTAPTCTEAGCTTHTCTCGDTYTDSETAALGHTEETLPAVAATCTTDGLTEGKQCTVCGTITAAQQTVPATGHTWDAGTVTQQPTESEEGETTYTCTACGETRTETIPALGHQHSYTSTVTAPTCTTAGYTTHTCTCGHTYTDTETPATGHAYTDGTCSACGQADPDWQDPEEPDVPDIPDVPAEPEEPERTAGANRFETSTLSADRMKENLGIEKFDAVVVASGMEFADALSGSYLAAVKNAPILLACGVESIDAEIKDYIKTNLKEGGTVYILGGVNAIPDAFKTGLEAFNVVRLAGSNRFETNLKVLEEAGVGGKTILVATGLNFADCLSASATGLPILLVYGSSLTDAQADFLSGNQNPLCILGGTGAVSEALEAQLKSFSTVERLAGADRFQTSVLIAEKFFENPDSAVLAYAWNFPDGLCGGPLAATMGAPLILTMERYEAQAANYIQTQNIQTGIILGGNSLIPDTSVNTIFGME